MDKLFSEWVEPEYVQTLYEVLAYCCYSSYPIQTLICLFGNGANGKSCFLKIISKFIGMKNMCSSDLDLLMGHHKSRFEAHKLYKKLVCMLGETNFGVLDKSSIMKRLTGEDPMGFEAKNKRPFDGYNYAKIIIASNSLPCSEDTSDGFARRWSIINFPNQFDKNAKLDVTSIIPDQEYRNLAFKVCNILPRLLEKGEFTNQGTIQERRERYQMASNPLPLFLKNTCFTNPNGFIRYGELYKIYCQFLTETNRRVISRKEFSKHLIEEGFENRKTSKNGQIDYYIEGIKWKKSPEDFPHFPDFLKSLFDFYTCKIKLGCREIEENKEISGEKDDTYTQTYTDIHLKCTYCGVTPCCYYDSKGRPVCSLCAKNPNLVSNRNLYEIEKDGENQQKVPVEEIKESFISDGGETIK